MATFPHVPPSVTVAAQDALLQMKQHGDLVQTCLESESFVCEGNTTEQECVINCLTTLGDDATRSVIPEQSWDAYQVMQDSEILGFTKSMNNLIIRNSRKDRISNQGQSFPPWSLCTIQQYHRCCEVPPGTFCPVIRRCPE
jgi:hypothetical protein